MDFQCPRETPTQSSKKLLQLLCLLVFGIGCGSETSKKSSSADNQGFALTLAGSSSSPSAKKAPVFTVKTFGKRNFAGKLLRGDATANCQNTNTLTLAATPFSITSNESEKIVFSIALNKDGAYKFFAQLTPSNGQVECFGGVDYVFDSTPPVILSLEENPPPTQLKAATDDISTEFCRTLPPDDTPNALQDDPRPRPLKRWNWRCNDLTDCQLRHTINQSATHTFNANAAYGDQTSATQKEGNGTYYLHLQGKDAVGNESKVLSYSAVLDTTAPELLRAEVAAGGYTVGSHLDIAISFSEIVTVDGTDPPRIALRIGSNTLRYAPYNAGSCTDQLVFRYTIDSAQVNGEGIVITAPPSIDLNGASISDVAGNPLGVLTFDAPESLGTILALTPRLALDKISLGHHHGCALEVDGAVKCWGYGANGEVGDGALHDRYTPTQVADEDPETDGGSLGAIVQVSAGGGHTCGLKSTGQVSCWGQGNYGQLGHDSLSGQNYPAAVVRGDGSQSLLVNVVQLSAGGYHTCALKSSGQVVCWGQGNYGQLGNLRNGHRDHPVMVVDEDPSTRETYLSNVIEISSGENHTCALKSSGQVVCWGRGGDGQLGHNATNHSHYPVRVVDEDTTTNTGYLGQIVQISAGGVHTCALKSTGTVRCWGKKGHGVGIAHAGGSSSPRTQNYPVQITAAGIVQLTTGAAHTCALRWDGGIRCWGHETNGVLGGGQILDAIQVSSGGYHNCALKSDGTVACWGSGGSGRLGNGDNYSPGHPVGVMDAKNPTHYFAIETYQENYRCSGGTCSLGGISLKLGAETNSPSNNNSPSIDVSGIAAGATVTLYSNSACSTSLGNSLTANGSLSLNPNSNQTNLAEGEHRFYFTVTRGGQKSQCSSNFIVYIRDTIPPQVPQVAPAESTGSHSSPNIRLRGVEPRSMVKIYRDSSCKTLAAPAARFYGTRGEITVDQLTGGPGDYEFYATATDLAGNESPCPKTAITYTLE